MGYCIITKSNVGGISHRIDVEAGSAVPINADRLQNKKASDFSLAGTFKPFFIIQSGNIWF